MSEKKLPHDSKFFSLHTSRIAAFYQGFLRVTGERCATHAVHPIVHLHVHLSASSNSRKKKKLHARAYAFWAAAWARGGLERPHFFSACAPKKFVGVVPAHTRAPKESMMQMSAISIP